MIMITLKESILDDIDVHVKRGDHAIKYAPIFDAIDAINETNADKSKYFTRLKYNQDMLGNEIEPGDILRYVGASADMIFKYGRWALAIGYKDKDDKNIHGSGRLCVIFGYSKTGNRENIEYSDRFVEKKILNNSKELRSYWGINANAFVIIKKGDKQLARLLQDVELNKNR